MAQEQEATGLEGQEEEEEEVNPELKEQLVDGAVVIVNQYRTWRDACREGEVGTYPTSHGVMPLMMTMMMMMVTMITMRLI